MEHLPKLQRSNMPSCRRMHTYVIHTVYELLSQSVSIDFCSAQHSAGEEQLPYICVV